MSKANEASPATNGSDLERPVMRICNRAHLCVKAKECRHAKPHEGSCGPSMPCHDDPSGEISMCVKVEDGQFKTHHRDWCQHCAGRGYHDRVELHDA